METMLNLASKAEDATGLSWPGLIVLTGLAVALVWGAAHWYRKRGGR